MLKNQSTAGIGLLALYCSVLLLALNGFFAKAIPFDATSITQYRSVIASVFLFSILIIQRSPIKLGSVLQYAGVYLLGVCLGLHWITYFYAMKISSVAIGMLSLFSYPVMTVVLEPLFKRHFPALKDIVAAVIVFFGVFLMISENLIDGDFYDGTIAGAGWGVFSALLFSLRNTAQKYVFPQVNSVALMAHQTLAIGILLLPFMKISTIVSITLEDVGLLILLGVFSTALAHAFLSKSLKHLSAKSVSLISCMTPVFGVLIAWWILDESPGVMVYIGGAVILSVAIFETVKQKSENERP